MIILNEEVAHWARIHAAKRDTSLSRMVGELLREKMLDEEKYQASIQHYLSQEEVLFVMLEAGLGFYH